MRKAAVLLLPAKAQGPAPAASVGESFPGPLEGAAGFPLPRT